VSLFEKRQSLDVYGKAFLLLALQSLEPDEHSRVATLVSDLSNAASRSATGAHWEEPEADHHTMNTDTRSTAVALLALARAIPEDPLVESAVRWLMDARTQGRWDTTQETAWSIMGLTEYLVVSGELEADYDYRVTVNGQLIGQSTVTAQDLEESRVFALELSELLAATANEIVLQRLTPSAEQSGKGQLYYSMHLRYFVPAEEVAALSRGVYVSRRYELLDAPGEAIDSVRVGDVVRVKLNLLAPNDLHYLVVEDPLPAGCEALDVSLKTTSAVYQGGQLLPEDQRSPYWCCFTHTELRDDKVVLFATSLGQGSYEYSYLMRASVPGRFLTRPAQAYEMYFPEVFGRSVSTQFTVEE
jgi:uncharacterized protein YfaS (alpha-2-macroglobulin family)